MKTTFWLCLLAVLMLSGCDDDSTPEVINPGILTGIVTIGPLCPVEPCPPNPQIYLSHKLLILASNKATVVQIVGMDSQGKYQTSLPTGIYFVDFTPHDIGIPGSFVPPMARIEAGKVTRLDIHIDTGIR